MANLINTHLNIVAKTMCIISPMKILILEAQQRENFLVQVILSHDDWVM